MFPHESQRSNRKEFDMNESPFITHRDKVLGHYGTAAWLRAVVLAMWNGSGYKIGLSNLTGLDRNHFEAFLDMVKGYHDRGESDPAFMLLADECRARKDQEIVAEKRQAELDDWCDDVKYELSQIGRKSYELDDRYEWFSKLFDAGKTPSEAAKACSLL